MCNIRLKMCSEARCTQLVLLISVLVFPAYTANIRLVGGARRNEGRVEVRYRGEWGTVCDHSWGEVDALVACRSLGYVGSAQSVIQHHFGPGDGLILMDNVECRGDETSLSDCEHSGWGIHNCGHSEDAGVICEADNDFDMRLIGGPSGSEGMLQVHWDGEWGSVCDYEFGGPEAEVVCAALGIQGGTEVLYNVYNGEEGPILMSNLQCTGRETSLIHCSRDDFGMHSCTHSRDVGVRCGVDEPEDLEIRLVGGTNANEGRVEVFYRTENEWGTVCDDSWDVSDAAVVCSYLGISGGTEVFHRAYFGEGRGRILLDDVQCIGTEAKLTDCTRTEWGQHNCAHSQDAGVRCGIGRDGDVDGDFSLRLVDGSNPREGRVEVLHNGEWGTICDDDWDVTDAAVVCSYLGIPGSSEAILNAAFGEGRGSILMDNVDCIGNEESLRDCSRSNWGQHDCIHGEDASVRCGLRDTDRRIRLIGGSSRSEGRVEIFHDRRWGTVCDDMWDMNDAVVVCHHLGYTGTSEAMGFGPGTGDIWMDDVTCIGTEPSLDECQHLGWGIHNCEHMEDAGVRCSLPDTTPDFDIRLVGGRRATEGRVEIFHEGVWGSICSSSWSVNEASVVCDYLHMSGTSEAVPRAGFGQGRGAILLSDVTCLGHETSLLECAHSSWGVHGCGHESDVGVRCALSDDTGVRVRLVGGNRRREGRVEIKHGRDWGTICADEWDASNAAIVCNSLGYTGTHKPSAFMQFGSGSGPIWLDNVRCAGDESSIERCVHRGWGAHNCGHNQDAGVICAAPDQTDAFDIRLVGGPSSTEGRVEVLHDGQWGTICSDFWDYNDALAVCTFLRITGRAEAITDHRYGDGEGHIWLDDIKCNGVEASLERCSHPGWNVHNCKHNQDAGVRCGLPDGSDFRIRLSGGARRSEGRVEVFHDGTWGTICHDMWDHNEAAIVCTTLGYTGNSEATTGGAYGEGSGRMWLSELSCVGDESSLEHCGHSGWGVHACSMYDTAGVKCNLPDRPTFNIRLAGGSKSQGRVEVFYSGSWGTVCNRGWDNMDAAVVCNQLGFTGRSEAELFGAYGEGSGDIWLTDVMCSGSEYSLEHCFNNGCEAGACTHAQDAGVKCGLDEDDNNFRIRLTGGSRRSEGRLEVFWDGSWGTVCDDSFHHRDASVVCHSLGYTGSSQFYPMARFGEGNDQIWMDEVQCTGSEATLDQCAHTGFGNHDCEHSEDVGIKCQLPDISPAPLRLVQGPDDSSGLLQVSVDDTWGTICLHGWNDAAATVACHQLGYTEGSTSVYDGSLGADTTDSPIMFMNIRCNGRESSLDNCARDQFMSHNCSHAMDVAIKCQLGETEQCRPGSYSSRGVIPCTPCPYGSYSKRPGATSCERCPEGTTTIQEASSTPSNCRGMVGKLAYQGRTVHEHGIRNMIIITNTSQTVTVPRGKIVQWNVDAKEGVPITLGVFREGRNSRRFEYVGGTTIEISNEGEHEIKLSAADQIEVRRGDVLGIVAMENQPISFQYTECGDGRMSTTMKRRITEAPEAGNEYVIRRSLTRVVCRIYLYGALIQLVED